MKFGMFFVGEYIGVTLISALIATLFFGGWLGPVLPPPLWMIIKTFAFICGFILVRAALPRLKVRSVAFVRLEIDASFVAIQYCSYRRLCWPQVDER